MKFYTTTGDGSAVVEVETEEQEQDRYDGATDREYTATENNVIAVWFNGIDIKSALSDDQLDSLWTEANTREEQEA